MKLSLLNRNKYDTVCEATTKWVGELDDLLGNGSDWSVNYGTSDPSRPPILYIKVPLHLVNSAIRKISKRYVIWADPNKFVGEIREVNGKEETKKLTDNILNSDPSTEVYPFPRLTSVGESHISITMGQELSGAIDKLKKEFNVETDLEVLSQISIDGQKIFSDDGSGLTTDVKIENPPFSVFRAAFYKDDVDTSGPMLVALNVETDLYSKVRVALGLSPTFKFPGSNATYKQHITLGYIPKKNEIMKSYMELKGIN